MTNDKHDWSYLAGLVDGEGNVCIWRTKARAHDYAESGKTYGSFNLRLSIVNTSVVLMKWLISHFGGSYRMTHEANEKHKAGFEWRPKGENNTQRLLLGILPYLVIKKEQAKIALAYIDLPRNCPEKREPLYQRMTQLNKRGITVETNTPNDSTESKIESELVGDHESASVVTLIA